MNIVHFDLNAFEVSSLEEAKLITVGNIELSDGSTWSHKEHWLENTKYTIEFFENNFNIDENYILLDYGCGTGRISKELIRRFNCKIIGTDTSKSMSQIAVKYVDSDRFSIANYDELANYKFDIVFSMWVLQHSYLPERDLMVIKESLKSNGKFVLFNSDFRYLPTVELGIVCDTINIKELTNNYFGKPIQEGKLLSPNIPKEFSETSYWAIYQKLDY